jgi:hypothetical protein
MLLRVYNRNEQGRPDLQKQRTRWEGDIGWWTDESEDEITSKIEEAVQKIEAMCKPLLIESKS